MQRMFQPLRTCSMSDFPHSEACGGPNRLSVYSSNGTVTALPVPVPLNTTLPGQWQYKGCFRLAQIRRALEMMTKINTFIQRAPG